MSVAKDAGTGKAGRHHRLKVSFSTAERYEIMARAEKLRLSASEFLRRLGLNTPLPDPAAFAAHKAVLELSRINADQSRLGNLLLRAIRCLEDRDKSRDLMDRLQGLYLDIRDTQVELKAGMVEIRRAVGRGQHRGTGGAAGMLF